MRIWLFLSILGIAFLAAECAKARDRSDKQARRASRKERTGSRSSSRKAARQDSGPSSGLDSGKDYTPESRVESKEDKAPDSSTYSEPDETVGSLTYPAPDNTPDSRPDETAGSRTYPGQDYGAGSIPDSRSYYRPNLRPDSRPNSGETDRPDNYNTQIYRPNTRPDSRRTDYGPDSRPETRPDSGQTDRTNSYTGPNYRPDYRPDSRRPDYRPDSRRPDNRPDSRRPDYRPDSRRPDYRPDSRRPDYRPDSRRPDYRPDSRPDYKPDYRPDSRPDSRRPDYRPDSRRPDYRPDSRRPDYRPDSRRPDYRPDSRPDYKPDYRPDSRPDSRRPDYRPDSRPDARPDYRPDSRPDARPDYRPDSRPDYRPRPTPDPWSGTNLQTPGCTEEFRKLPASTMCDYTDDYSATNTGVSLAEQRKIVDLHNKYRSDVYPAAQNMQKMYWDVKLAALAQKWANTCEAYHDKGVQRQIPDYLVPIGQNWAGGYETWDDALTAWQEEKFDFRYGEISTLHVVGHYTQMVTADTAAVGCGYTECPNRSMRTNFVCNYAFAQSNIDRPYESGGVCAQCPGNCEDNMCDCGGMFCKNGGTLDINRCKCSCPDTASGPSCENLNCPAADKSYCGKAQPYGYPKELCEQYSAIWAQCPVMCGICDEPCPGKTADYCEQGGTLLSYNCQCQCPPGYKGFKCHKFEVCEPDMEFCGRTYPHGYTEDYCGKYNGIDDICPQMCGRC